ncbi:hypothetical protein RSOL_447670 [Rhizoctonia solani AG-3 Rhs1AP]|uniref:DUF7918 domain-containing protein n=1 Tax=Rhizoctonia solani AG-3 Rhs1AP TaxID=1086054 RepID=X8JNJ7_9AGAM|nr:hypothetical protein RSOL_447670 [Rhizoctonia solani AG-3 Rhs1AP]
MIFEKHGFSVWIVDSNDTTLPEYQVQEMGDDTIKCWIPSTEGKRFKILWKVVENLHPKHDLRTVPFLDGVQMSGKVSRKHKVAKGLCRQHFRQRTGETTARLYEFGRRTLTDSDDGGKLNPSLLDSLNTVKLVVDWGHGGPSAPRKTFYVPQEVGPIHEKSVKKGHSGAAQLGAAISVSASNGMGFTVSKKIKPITFIFCYAPEDWLRARDIVPHGPELDSQDIKSSLKRERSTTPDIIDIDDLETDDEIYTAKHKVPAPVTVGKKQRTLGQDDAAKTEEK